MSRGSRVLSILAMACALLGAGKSAWSAPVVVEPADLTKRTDLLGKEVSVDDRVSLFLLHQGKGFDEITLKRTPVLFRLPPRLRYQRHPGALAVRLSGVLKREGEQWVCDVTSINLLPKDLVRLNQGVAPLPAGEYEKRGAWAAWARRRGHDFQDEALSKRALELEIEALRNEAESRSNDPPRLWLELAHRARKNQVPEPEPSALAHRAFRARLARVKSVEDLTQLQTEIASFFPTSDAPVRDVPLDMDKWEDAYQQTPDGAYRSASSPGRRALDHRLWADATQRLLERTGELHPELSLAQAEKAEQILSDRPDVVKSLYKNGLETASQRLDKLRLSEVKALAKTYEDKLNQPELARDLLRRWLNEQRDHQTSVTDAEGRMGLADLYESLLQDRATAIELLNAAWKIDPESKLIADAFRRRGYRKVDDRWVDSKAPGPKSTSGEAEASRASAPDNRNLTNLTPSQVRDLLGGRPNRVAFSGVQGQMIEQWIYFGTRQDQYINFLHLPGSSAPRVVAYYSLPRKAPKSQR